MKKLTQGEIETLYKVLPNDVQSALSSVDQEKKLQEIMREQDLHVDEAGLVVDLVTLTLLGVYTMKEFIPTLTAELSRLPKDKILSVAEAVNRKVFQPIRSSLEKLTVQRINQEPRESVAVPESHQPLPTHEQKMTEPTQVKSTERDVSYINVDPKVKVIPVDAKQRINNDPYKEPIE